MKVDLGIRYSRTQKFRRVTPNSSTHAGVFVKSGTVKRNNVKQRNTNELNKLTLKMVLI